MKFKLLLFVLMLAPSLTTAQRMTNVASSEITFVFLSKSVKGSIAGFTSSSTIDLSTISQSDFKGSVKVETIKTGNFLRDWSLKGSKYFDADEHPLITFESTSVTAGKNGFEVKGQLSIKGTVKTATFDFEKNGNTLVGHTTLYSSDFGIHIKDDRQDNKVEVKIVLVLE